MLCCNDRKKLQEKLEDLYCNDCGMCMCQAATTLCDCCVDPMQDLLTQLRTVLPATATIQLTLNNAATQSFLVSQIVSIDDSVISLNINGINQFISICNISRARWRGPETIALINLLPPVCTCDECDCYERPLRERLNRLIGSNVQVQFEGQLDPNATEPITIRKVGLGIVVGQNVTDGAPDAYSVCKITKFVQA